MTEAQIYTLLSGLNNGKIFPYVAPLDTAAPWIIFSLPTEKGDDVIDGQSGYKATSLQIDIYSNRIDEANQIMNLVEAAIMPLKPVSLLKTKGYEPDTGLRRATIEVQV